MSVKKLDQLKTTLYHKLKHQLCSEIPPGRALPLGHVKGAKKLLRHARKLTAAHRDWQKRGSVFFFQGNVLLPFCAVWGPIFAVQVDGNLVIRLRTVLVQYDADDQVEAFAVEVVKGSAQLARRLCLNPQEASALTAMVKTSSELFAEAEYLLEINSTDMVPTKSLTKHFSNSYSEQQFLDVLTSLGQTGRELFLTGILQQLSPFLPAEHRPCLLINVVGFGRELPTIRSLLGAVNFSSFPSGEGTAPPIRFLQGDGPLPNDAHLTLYQIRGTKNPFLLALERAELCCNRSGTAVCPFPAIPILLTDSSYLRGYLWSIEVPAPLPELNDCQLDCLRTAAASVLRRPKPLLEEISRRVAEARCRSDSYRTTEVERWRQALVSVILSALFPSSPFLDQVTLLFRSDAEQAAHQAALYRAQIQEALRLLDDPSTYQDGGVVPLPRSREEANEQLKSAFALFYQPSATRTNRPGPFLCFTDESLCRLLAKNSIPKILLEEIIGTLRTVGRLSGRTEPVQFKTGKPERFIKLDMHAAPGFLTLLQFSQPDSGNGGILDE